RLLSLAGGVRQGPFQPSVSKNACDVVGWLGVQMDTDEAAMALDVFEPFIPRPQNSYRPTDEAMLRLFSVVQLKEAVLRPRNMKNLIACLEIPSLHRAA